MIAQKLKDSIKTIQELINSTKLDLDDIKHARHQSLFNRSKLKEDLLFSFESQKATIDSEIAKIVAQNSQLDLEALLSQEEHSLLDELRESLEILKEYNKQYAVMVLSVSEFYTSLLNEILPKESVGYNNTPYSQRATPPQFIQVKG